MGKRAVKLFAMASVVGTIVLCLTREISALSKGVTMRLARFCTRGRAQRYAVKAAKNASEVPPGAREMSRAGCPYSESSVSNQESHAGCPYFPAQAKRSE